MYKALIGDIFSSVYFEDISMLWRLV